MVGPNGFELEPICGRERSRGPGARISRDGVAQREPAGEIPSEVAGHEGWSARMDSNVRRLAGVSAAGVAARGFRVTGWHSASAQAKSRAKSRDLRDGRPEWIRT